MKFYLSSYKIGNDLDKLKKLIPANKKTAYISNALDFSSDIDRRRQSEASDVDSLKNLGLDVEVLDLREYFDKPTELEKKILEFGVIWVRGGNVFVLRQAMKMSGFDNILKNILKNDVLYGGFSAGICVLAPTLQGMDLIDDLTARPYGDQQEIVWDGLNILNYSIVPHYHSDHPESESANKVVEYMIENKLLFKVLRDGEVIVI